MTEGRNTGELANAHEEDVILVLKDTFCKGEQLCMQGREPRRVKQVLSEFSFMIEDISNGQLKTVRATRLKYYPTNPSKRQL